MQAAIITGLNNRMAGSSLLQFLLPILSDIFVFTYPIYLIYLYFSTNEKTMRREKIIGKQTNKISKYHALTIFFATATGVIANYIVKAFVSESRPYHMIDLAINPKQALILSHLPTDTFPSDHATVGMVIAASTLLLGYKEKNRSMITMGRLFLGFTLIMNFSRIAIGVHRPADILGGMGIGILVAIIFTLPSIEKFLTIHIYDPLIKLQENIFGGIWKKRSK